MFAASPILLPVPPCNLSHSEGRGRQSDGGSVRSRSRSKESSRRHNGQNFRTPGREGWNREDQVRHSDGRDKQSAGQKFARSRSREGCGRQDEGERSRNIPSGPRLETTRDEGRADGFPMSQASTLVVSLHFIISLHTLCIKMLHIRFLFCFYFLGRLLPVRHQYIAY